MAGCPNCKTRVTRWWWFAKIFGTGEWTAKCSRCGLNCAIEVSKQFCRASKLWAVAACLGIYTAVGGFIYAVTVEEHVPTSRWKIGMVVGLAGFAATFVFFVAALVADVRNSIITLTAAVVCNNCGERLPDDYAGPDCPVCGRPLHAAMDVKEFF